MGKSPLSRAFQLILFKHHCALEKVPRFLLLCPWQDKVVAETYSPVMITKAVKNSKEQDLLRDSHVSPWAGRTAFLELPVWWVRKTLQREPKEASSLKQKWTQNSGHSPVLYSLTSSMVQWFRAQALKLGYQSSNPRSSTYLLAGWPWVSCFTSLGPICKMRIVIVTYSRGLFWRLNKC